RHETFPTVLCGPNKWEPCHQQRSTRSQLMALPLYGIKRERQAHLFEKTAPERKALNAVLYLPSRNTVAYRHEKQRFVPKEKQGRHAWHMAIALYRQTGAVRDRQQGNQSLNESHGKRKKGPQARGVLRNHAGGQFESMQG